MISRLLKYIGITLILGILLIATGIVYVLYSPQTLLSLTHRFTPYTVSATTVDLRFKTPALTLSNVEVKNTQGEITAQFEKLSLSSQWGNVLGKQKHWDIDLQDGTVNVLNSAKNHTETQQHNTTAEKTAIHSLLAMGTANIKNVTINIDNDTAVVIQNIENISDASETLQGLNVKAMYSNKEQALPINLTITSDISGDIPAITIESADIDLRSVLKNTPAKNQPKNDQKNTLSNFKEAAIDWSTLTHLAPLTLSVKATSLLIPQGILKNIDSSITVRKKGNTLQIQQQHSAQVDVNMDNEISLQQAIMLSTDWHTLGAQTQGADIKGDTTMSVGKNSIKLKGATNLNGLTQDALAVSIQLEDIPITSTTLFTASQRAELSALLPFQLNTVSSVVLTEKPTITLTNTDITTKDSDLSGNVSVQLTPTFEAITNAVFDLQSKQVTIPSNNKKPVADTQAGVNKSVFSDIPIPTQWMTLIEAKGKYVIDTLVNDATVIAKGISVDATLEKDRLSLTAATEEVAGGSAEMTALIDNTADQLQITINGAGNNILLEALALISKDQLTGGKTDFLVNINSSGNTSRALASRANGDLLIEITEGVIANNTFELLGSDIILKLLNSINPFYKESLTTDLECAVVKSKISDGKMLFDDSIAIKTSRVIIIADGNIDLGKEKINLGINPKGRAGVGVDIASLAKFVALKGDLNSPEIGISGQGTVKSALTIGAAVSTGGLSLIAGKLFDTAVASDPCKTAKAAFTQKK